MPSDLRSLLYEAATVPRRPCGGPRRTARRRPATARRCRPRTASTCAPSGLPPEAGTQAGAVFLYQGAPSWLLVSLPGAPANGQYAITITTRDGWRYPAGVCTVGPGSTTAGYELSTPVSAIARIDMEGPGGVRLAASLP